MDTASCRHTLSPQHSECGSGLRGWSRGSAGQEEDISACPDSLDQSCGWLGAGRSPFVLLLSPFHILVDGVKDNVCLERENKRWLVTMNQMTNILVFHFYLQSCQMTQQGQSIQTVVTFKRLIKNKYGCHCQQFQNHLNARTRCINLNKCNSPLY